jgi:hypothetical protein
MLIKRPLTWVDCKAEAGGNRWKELFLSKETRARIPGSNAVDMAALHPGKSVKLKRKGKFRIASSLRSKRKQASLNVSCTKRNESYCLTPEVERKASLAERVLYETKRIASP